jgi:hypothetical protein
MCGKWFGQPRYQNSFEKKEIIIIKKENPKPQSLAYR